MEKKCFGQMNRNPKYLGLIGECLCVVKKKALDICTVPTVKYGRGFVGGRSNNLRRKVWPFYQNRENIEKGGVFENFAETMPKFCFCNKIMTRRTPLNYAKISYTNHHNHQISLSMN